MIQEINNDKYIIRKKIILPPCLPTKLAMKIVAEIMTKMAMAANVKPPKQKNSSILVVS